MAEGTGLIIFLWLLWLTTRRPQVASPAPTRLDVPRVLAAVCFGCAALLVLASGVQEWRTPNPTQRPGVVTLAPAADPDRLCASATIAVFWVQRDNQERAATVSHAEINANLARYADALQVQQRACQP